jgi:tetratricopeptide (TPR) repeat protein
VWVNEGIAEFYEQTVIRGKNFKVGFSDEGWWSLLRQNRLIPFDTLQRFTHSSEYYNVRKKRQIFYAQSWALVQYLMTGEEGARLAQFGQYVSLVGRGVPLDEAFRAAFQLDYKSFQKEFEAYLRRGRYNYYTGKLPAKIVTEVGEPSPLSSVVAQAHAADLWINSGRVGEVEHALRELAATGPPAHEVQYRLGRIHMIKREWAEAEKYFQSALELNPDDLSARYYAAMSLMIGRQQGQEEADRRVVASQVVELLTPVVERSQNFADAHRMLISARMQRGDDAKEIIPVVEMVRKRNPQETELSFMLVGLYMQEKRWDDVEIILNQLGQQALSTEEEGRVRQQLNWLQERREWSSRLSQTGEDAVQFSGGRTVEGVEGNRGNGRRKRMPVEPVPAPVPATPPEVKFVEGRLIEVACEGEGAVLTVQPKERKAKPLRVAVRSLERVLLLDPTNSGYKLVCGEANARVAVNYRVQPREPDIDGDVVTIELNPTSL